MLAACSVRTAELLRWLAHKPMTYSVCVGGAVDMSATLLGKKGPLPNLLPDLVPQARSNCRTSYRRKPPIEPWRQPGPTDAWRGRAAYATTVMPTDYART